MIQSPGEHLTTKSTFPFPLDLSCLLTLWSQKQLFLRGQLSFTLAFKFSHNWRGGLLAALGLETCCSSEWLSWEIRGNESLETAVWVEHALAVGHCLPVKVAAAVNLYWMLLTDLFQPRVGFLRAIYRFFLNFTINRKALLDHREIYLGRLSICSIYVNFSISAFAVLAIKKMTPGRTVHILLCPISVCSYFRNKDLVTMMWKTWASWGEEGDYIENVKPGLFQKFWIESHHILG